MTSHEPGGLSTELYHHSLQTCVSTYVKEAVLDPRRRVEIMETLKRGAPYVTKGYAVTMMVDISGYSTVTSKINDRFMDELSHSMAFRKDNSSLKDSKTLNLFIHVALTAAEIENVIIGDPDLRLDYCINGPSLQKMGDVLDLTESGELGMTLELYSQLTASTNMKDIPCKRRDECVTLTQNSVRALYNAMEPHILSVVSAVIPTFEETPNLGAVNLTEATEEAFSMFELFINQSLLRKLRFGKEAQSFVSLPRNSKELSTTPYVSGSLTKRATVKVNSEFRVVSVIFVKLLSPFEPQKAQTVMVAFLNILKHWEGFFQQYSVDDKGQTMLACFGLPPLTHEKDPLNALNAALDFQDFCQKKSKSVGPVSISVATGELLFSLLGSGERRDASLLGDVVNISARLVSLPTPEAIVKCDKATHNITKHDLTLTSVGLHQVKGKVDPIEIWSVRRKDTSSGKSAGLSAKTLDMVGYGEEKERLKDAIGRWRHSDVSTRIVIEGPSGIGKSTLLNFLCHEAQEVDLKYCLIQGTEIKQYTPYTSIQSLVNYIFQQYLRLSGGDIGRGDVLEASKPAKRYSRSSTVDPTKRASTSSVSPVSLVSANQSITTLNRQGDYELAEGFLRFLGEDTGNVSLLGDVMPMFRLLAEGDRADTAMDAQVRSLLLKNMVARMVKASLALEKCVIIFDDSQWLDAISLDIILEIVKTNPEAMIVLFTRPIAESQVQVLSNMIQIPGVLHIVLLGIVLHKDIETFLIQKLDTGKITKYVSERVCHVILEKSNGRPLYIDLITESLLEEFDKTFEVTTEGELVFKGSDPESRIGTLGLGSVMTKFDRLNPSLQAILLRASILGQYFTLKDLSFFLNGTPVDEIQKIIEENDTYHYLIKHDSDATSGDLSDHPYFFRHIQLMQAFYSSQSFAELSSTHLQAAEYYENKLDSSNRENLLPIVVHHYRKTSKLDKQVTYLEELGIRNFYKWHIIESSNYLEILVKLVAENADTLNIDKERHARWLAFLAIQKVSASVYTVEQIEHAVLALRLVGAIWPENSKQAGRAILRAAMTLFRLWKATAGGTRMLSESSDCFRRPRRRRYYNLPQSDSVAEIMWRAYNTIFQMGCYTHHVDNVTILLVMLSQCCVAILSGHKKLGEWTGTLYWASFGLSWTLVPVCNIFWKQAQKLEQIITSAADIEQLDEYIQCKGFHLVHLAKFQDSIKAFNRGIRYFDKHGDLSKKITSTCYLSMVGICIGDITSHEELFLELSKERDTFQVLHIIYLTNRKMLSLDFQEARVRHQRTLDLMKKNPPNGFMENVIQANEAWLAFQDGDLKKSLDIFELSSKGLGNLRTSHLDTGRLLLMVEELMKTTLFFEQKEMRMLSLAHVMLKSIKLFLLDRKKKAMGLLLAELKSPRSIEIMSEMKPSKAYIYSVLALHLTNDADRQYYLRDALQMYQEFGFTYMEMWLVWNDQHLSPRRHTLK
ncbi:hypothetical protein HDV05_008573 [Chytridiales sp. JEL 0842]|nr:hypothetical protein HDV05_008573 [Chytridiales sp. JEL 0842]